VRQNWYAPNNMTLIIVGDLDRLLPAYLERTYGALEPVEPSEHKPLAAIDAKADAERELVRGVVGDTATLHWLLPEPVIEGLSDETWSLLRDYLEWALYSELRLKKGLSYGPWAEREVFGGVGFLSLNADVERDNVAQARQVVEQLKAQLLKDGLDPQIFARLKNAAIARKAWSVQGNSALADYYWSSLGDYDDGHFADPAKQLQAITLKQANTALRELFAEPGYVRIEKPLFSYQGLSMAIFGGLVLLVIVGVGWRAWRRR
jgi:predicted Zn-dependent peptidase